MNKQSYPIEKSPLWKLESRKRLISLLNIKSYSRLNALISSSESYYREFTRPKINGKLRHIRETMGEIKTIHQRFSNLIRRIETPVYHMSKKGSSCKKNAEFHKNNNYLFTTDICNFFPSCTRIRVAHSFKEHFKISGDIAHILSKILTFQESVPQGGHASDIICFWSNYSMFEEINNFCLEYGLCFSLYVDDIAISSKDYIAHKYRYGVNKILKKNGFQVAEQKTKYFKKGQTKHINGIVIKNGKIAVENSKRKKLFTTLDKPSKGKPNDQSLLGLFNYCRSIEVDFSPTLEKKLKREN